jgi:hypothetical protein
MARKAEPKPKLTDAERHKRFVDMAREVEASNDPKDFERAFTAIVPSARIGPPQGHVPSHRDKQSEGASRRKK